MEDVGEPLVDESFGHGRFVSCHVALSVETLQDYKDYKHSFSSIFALQTSLLLIQFWAEIFGKKIIYVKVFSLSKYMYRKKFHFFSTFQFCIRIGI